MSTSNCPHCGEPILLMKSVAAPPPKPPAPPVPKHDGELKLVKCNRCGEGNLCWQESKNGKFYLARTQMTADGPIPLRKEFHTFSPIENR
jgi:hypothetical protein